MTKDQIINKYAIGKDVFIANRSVRLFPIEEAKKAMSEYARQQAMAFAEWIKETNWAEKDTWGKHDPPSIPTMDQLYSLYLEQSKDKQP